MTKKQKLLLVDFDARIAGVEDYHAAGMTYITHNTTEFAQSGEFREVSETLAACAAGQPIHEGYDFDNHRLVKRCCEGGWNPQGFHGGTMTGSIIGPLAVVEAVFRRWIWPQDIGQTIEVGGVEYVIRPCAARLMPIRLWERHKKPCKREWAREEQFGLEQARRLCFVHRNDPKPVRVYFAKGTTSVEPPVEAVARIGGSESDTVVFLDKFARPISAYKASGSWDSPYAQSISIPDKLDWRRLRSLGKSTRDILFGVHG